MVFWMKKQIVHYLEKWCLHRIPGFWCRMADLSAKLDEKWETGLWHQTVTSDDEFPEDELELAD